MSEKNVTEVPDTKNEEFEAPELTEIGDASDVVLGVPFSGWEHRGMSADTFEFEPDGE